MRQHLHLSGATPAALEPAPDAVEVPIPVPGLAQLVERHPAQFRLVPAARAANGQRDAVPGEIAGCVEAFRAHLLMRTDAERFGKLAKKRRRHGVHGDASRLRDQSAPGGRGGRVVAPIG